MDWFISSPTRLSLYIFVFCAPVWAATQANVPRFSISSQKPQFIEQGLFIGGESDRPLSLLDLKVFRSKSGAKERMKLQFADQKGQPLRQNLGFTHVAIENNPPRVVIDLAQVLRTSIDGEVLKKVFKNSKNVATTAMTMDPEDHSTNITLYLKGPSLVSVRSLPDSMGQMQLVVDIREKPKRVVK